MLNTRVVAGLLTLAPALLLTGCGDNALVSQAVGSMEEQRAELLRRPSIEEVNARYEAMSNRLVAELGSAFPRMHWGKWRETNRAACADFDAFEGTAESWTLGIWAAEGGLADTDWARAEAIFAKVAAEYGFSTPKTIVDQPGNHEVTSSDQFGAVYNLGTGKRTTFSGSTGCHLLQAEKDKQQHGR